MKKAFIEYDFPVKEVSEHSAREKNIRHGQEYRLGDTPRYHPNGHTSHISGVPV